MKISFDLHGVIDDLPEVFQFITSATIQAGGEVHIITGSTNVRALQELENLGYKKDIHFTHVVGLPDYLYNLGYEVTGYCTKHGNPEFSAKDWNTAKAKYCKEQGINLHMDDTIEYGEHFCTPFARLWTKNK